MIPNRKADAIAREPAADATGSLADGPPTLYLILAYRTDETAMAVACSLQQRHGTLAVELRSPEELELAPLWDHRVSATGVRTEIGLGDGSRLARNAPSVIFNRIGYVDPPQFRNAEQVDRDYARMEMFALMLSWLNSPGCPAINRPGPAALAGNTYRAPMWHRLAQLSGLTTVRLMATSSTRRFPAPRAAIERPDVTYTRRPYDLDGRPRLNDFSWYSEPIDRDGQSFLAIGGELPADAPVALREPCRRLVELADTEILRINFVASADASSGWAFAGADPFPAVTDPTDLMRIVHLLETAAGNAAMAAGRP
jgi:hypothetical protein